MSAIIEGNNKDSGRFINNLGFYSSCEESFRPSDSKSVDSKEVSLDASLKEETEYKKYYLARIYWLFKLISKSYIGYCVPETCTKKDIQEVVTAIFGNNFASMNVIDVVQFK